MSTTDSPTATARRRVRVLHTSDVHLGPGTRDAGGLEHTDECLCPIEVMEHFVEEHGVDLVLIVGDLFDNVRISDTLVRATLERLAALPAEVVILPGNHDVHDETTVFLRNREALEASGVWFFDEHDGRLHHVLDGAVRVWARAMPEHSPSYVPLQGAPTHPGAGWYVVAGHGHLTTPGDGRSSPITVEEVSATGADYVALGHWHVTTDLGTRGATVPAWYSGAPLFGHGAGRMLLVELDDEHPEGPVRVQPLPVVGHHRIVCG